MNELPFLNPAQLFPSPAPPEMVTIDDAPSTPLELHVHVDGIRPLSSASDPTANMRDRDRPAARPDVRERLKVWAENNVKHVSSTVVPMFRSMRMKYKSLSNENRDKIMFCISTMLGTILFYFFFEFLIMIHRRSTDNLQLAFTASYLIANIVSIIWQHLLNRYFVYGHAPFCESLMHTYIVYSLTLTGSTVFGALLIRVGLDPRITMVLCMAASGMCNYYLLMRCFSPAHLDKAVTI